MTIQDTMSSLGFKADTKLATRLLDDAANPEVGGADMSEHGPYKVHNAWTKGDVKVWLEQNTAPDTHEPDEDEAVAVVTHPRVLIVESPKGRVAVKPSEAATIADVVDALS